MDNKTRKIVEQTVFKFLNKHNVHLHVDVATKELIDPILSALQRVRGEVVEELQTKDISIGKKTILRLKRWLWNNSTKNNKGRTPATEIIIKKHMFDDLFDMSLTEVEKPYVKP